MDVEAVPLPVIVGLVAVDRQQGEDGNHLQTLAHDVGQAGVVGLVVVGGQVQHAPGQGVHNVLAGRLEDHVPDEIGGQGSGNWRADYGSPGARRRWADGPPAADRPPPSKPKRFSCRVPPTSCSTS